MVTILEISLTGSDLKFVISIFSSYVKLYGYVIISYIQINKYKYSFTRMKKKTTGLILAGKTTRTKLRLEQESNLKLCHLGPCSFISS